MFEVRQTLEYEASYRRLRDIGARSGIDVRIRRAALGNLGDAKFFGGIGELRIDYGPGYRVYFLQRGDVLIVLLCGGDKATQESDIALARTIAKRWKEN